MIPKHKVFPVVSGCVVVDTMDSSIANSQQNKCFPQTKRFWGRWRVLSETSLL